ncbi:glycosyltransferase [Hirschia maritima]|uniref:glycosyltransferase n=1 Tax=Hirschia maritima TaxID=1121961 RepID=UPI0012DC665C|nr:glycosyltransferase [Hirschia maritima]
MNSESPTNILVYADKLFSPSESFIQRSYSHFTRLKPIYIGHDIRGPAPEGSEFIKLGESHGLLGEMGFKQFGRVSRRLLTRLEQKKPALIHAHFGKSGAYALPLAKALNIPLVVTYHGGDATKHSNTKDSFFRVYNRRRQSLWNEASLILPVSKFIENELRIHGCPQPKMRVHYNGVDPTKFSQSEKKKIILFAGRWVEKKGIDTLISALTLLKDDLEGWEVRLLGEGPLKPELSQHLVKAGIEANLPGWVDSEDMPEHFAKSSIVCVPSKRAVSGDAEGLPMVCIEAQLSACAVVATRHAGIPECILDKNTGYLVEENDHIAFARRLKDLLCSPETITKFGQNGETNSKKMFNLQNQSKSLETILSNMISSQN